MHHTSSRWKPSSLKTFRPLHARVGGTDDLRQIVVYIATTTRDPERWHRFADAVLDPTLGRQEGELRGKVLTIEGFLGRDVPWSTIEAATGVDQATFGRLKQQLEAAADDTSHRN